MGARRIIDRHRVSTGLFALLFALLLQGCAQNSPTAALAEEASAKPQETKAPERLERIPDRNFSEETLYSLLVAELAFNRKRYDIALSNYVQQASNTQDIGIVERATQIARGLRARRSALEMSQLWLDLDPSDPDARLVASIELIEANHLLEAFELSREMLERGETTAFENIAMKAEKGDISIVNQLLERIARIKQSHPSARNDAGLWLGESILLQQAGKLDQALTAIKQAQAVDGKSVSNVFQEARVLQQLGQTEAASERLAELVEENPNNIGLRARYARLVWNRAPDEARNQFEILHKQAPSDAEILYSLALVEKDLGHMDSAKSRFDLLLSRGQYPSAAHYHLGDIYQTRNQLDRALAHYTQVGSGKNYVASLVKATDLLIAQNRRQDAIKLVKERQKNNEGEVLESLYMLEADIYTQAQQDRAAEDVLNEGVGVFPNSTRLLYTRALLYARIDYVSGAEADLKKVLELVPENAAALNALGYTLADRTDRYQEAYEYIKQAYALSPDDPAIIDSMGWVHYRMGNFEVALDKLRRAMEILPDHEIAAHLGEVLWVTGQHQEALTTWQQGLEQTPDSKIIHETMHRLEAKLD